MYTERERERESDNSALLIICLPRSAEAAPV